MIPVTVTFYGDVGFDRSYNHIIDFSNKSERDRYFNTKVLKVIQDCAYNKPMNSIQIKCNYEEALKFTYCKFEMGSSPNSRKEIYAWVDDVVLVTDQIERETYKYLSIIEVQISIDPIQTFMFDFTIGESFVVREHVNRWSLNEDGTKGWELGNTADSSSCGTEFRRPSIYNFRNSVNIYDYVSDEAPVEEYYKHDDYIFWLAIQYCLSGTSYMKVVLVPVTLTLSSCRFSFSTYSTTGKCITINEVLQDEYLGKLGILGKSVAGVNLIPFDLGTFTDDTTNHHSVFNFDVTVPATHYTPSYYNGYAVIDLSLQYYTSPFRFRTIISKTISLNINEPFEPINHELFSVNNKHEPQLYKQPYRRLSIINENNIEVCVFPDIFANSDNPFKNIELQILFDTVDVRCRVIPKIYSDKEVDNKYWVEFNCIPVDVIRDNWLEYLLQEREATRSMIQSQNNQQLIASAIGGVSSGVSQGGSMAVNSGAGAGLAGLGIGLGVGAIQTVGGFINNQHFAFEQQDIREDAIRRKANNVIQPGTMKSILLLSPYICFTECDTTTLTLKSLEYHKYGYNVSRYETPNIKTRKYFNFIATTVVKINGNLNNSIKMAIAQVFDNGVTIWHGDYINELSGVGDYSKENIERSLI